MLVRCILPNWAKEKHPDWKKAREGDFSDQKIQELNAQGYNIYFLPNSPDIVHPGRPVEGADISTFHYVFIDMDLKDGTYQTKDEFLATLAGFPLTPTDVVDSGNGIHVYWEVTDLDAIGYLRLQRRLMRHFSTDPAVGQIYQLMRVPGTKNTKDPEHLKECTYRLQTEYSYTAEQLDAILPVILPEDEQHCQQHYNKTYKKEQAIEIDEKLPLKFELLLDKSPEIKEIWAGDVEDRSKADYRLGHLLFANGLSREEAASVLVNTAKAIERAPVHRVSYATNIIDKIWTYEMTPDSEKKILKMSKTVREILEQGGDALKGTRFACFRHYDATEHGFRLGQVIGLVAGSGVGKTAVALDMFRGFVQNNPEYEHFFVPLEQPGNEIADRWRKICGDQTQLYDKVHILSNYDDDGNFRHLSLEQIKEHLLTFRKLTGKKIGCVVIDHIGALSKKTQNGENQGLMDICHEMKGFAVQTNTLLIMQSQAPREKAGVGDIMLSKDAAYGTVFFESYCDYLITLWQPLKRMYSNPDCPKVTAFMFCKIRHKNTDKDEIQEDVRYRMTFDPNTGILSEMTQEEEEKKFDYYNGQATNLRKQDRKTEVLTYVSTGRPKEGNNGKAGSNPNAKRP